MLSGASENLEEIQNSSTDTLREKLKGKALKTIKAIH